MSFFESLASQRQRYPKAIEKPFINGEFVAADVQSPDHKFFHQGVRFVINQHVFPEPLGALVHVCADPMLPLRDEDEGSVRAFLQHAVDAWREISGDERPIEFMGKGPLGALHFSVPFEGTSGRPD